MKKTELFFASILVLIFTLKAFNTAYCSEIAILTLFSLAPIYMVGGYFLFKETKNYAVISIVTGLLFALAFIGILFKMQSWVYAEEMLSIPFWSMLILLFIVLALYFFDNKNNNNNNNNNNDTTDTKLYCKNMAIRYALMLVLMGGLLQCQGNTIFDFCHRNDAELIRLHTKYTKNPADSVALDSLRAYTRLHR